MNILAVSAHPDDIEINCAGTLIKYAKQGHNVFMVNLCNGDLGHAHIKSKELREMRLQESRRSAAIIGAEHITMDVGDLMLYHQNKELRDKTVDILRYTKPDLIITHTPDDYMSDHVAVSNLVFDASFCASLPQYASKHPNVVDICPIFYMDNLGGFKFEPTEYVDISEYINVKMQMLDCHETQVKWMLDHDNIDFKATVRAFSRTRGAQAGVEYAEGFKQQMGWGRVRTYRMLP